MIARILGHPLLPQLLSCYSTGTQSGLFQFSGSLSLRTATLGSDRYQLLMAVTGGACFGAAARVGVKVTPLLRAGRNRSRFNLVRIAAVPPSAALRSRSAVKSAADRGLFPGFARKT